MQAKALDQLTKLQAVVSHVEESEGAITSGREIASAGLSQMQGINMHTFIIAYLPICRPKLDIYGP